MSKGQEQGQGEGKVVLIGAHKLRKLPSKGEIRLSNKLRSICCPQCFVQESRKDTTDGLQRTTQYHPVLPWTISQSVLYVTGRSIVSMSDTVTRSPAKVTSWPTVLIARLVG